MESLTLEAIRLDGGTQPRAEIDEALVAEYADSLKGGAKFPPVVAFFDGKSYWLADGFHRYHAHRGAGLKKISVDVKKGTKRDAQWFSFGANQTHGKRRERGDAKLAIERILQDAEWATTPQNKIAEHVGVVPSYVSEVKASIQYRIDRPSEQTVTRGGTTYTQDTSSIGRKPTEVIDAGEVSSSPFMEPTDKPKRLGVGIEYAHEAINMLKKIPAGDALRGEGFRTVKQWMRGNA